MRVERELVDGLAYVEPRDIERRSFATIRSELGETGLDELSEAVLMRVIHATADFDYARTLHFTPGAAAAGVEALRSGAHIVCDTTMAASGINARALSSLGGAVHAFVGDADVAAEAASRHCTRSAVAMERGAALAGPLIFAIGNAPTALARVARMVEEHAIEPALVVGVPVGFVNVLEAKDLIEHAPVSSIVARGRKGGSTVAVAIMNALIYAATGDIRR